jgi:hypothetical protein
MANYNDTDISVRLANLRCSIADKAQILVNKKKYGLAKKCDERTLQVLVAFEWIICSYVTTSDNNLITETELDNIFNFIQRVCNLNFAPKGYNYFLNVPVISESAILLNDGSNLLLNDSTNILLNA